jgi:RNA polymerase sigma-70 factor (ECF subfamily)
MSLPIQNQIAEYRSYLLRFARLQLRNDAWAEDAASETMLAALSGLLPVSKTLCLGGR